MHMMQGDTLVHEPKFMVSTLTHTYSRHVRQIVGAIHMHPAGHTVYVSNRNSGTVDFTGQKVFDTGENNIAVYSISRSTGEPTLIQHAEPKGFHIRLFTLDPTGSLLIAATMVDMLVRDGSSVRSVPAGLNLFQSGKDGHLTIIREYDVELPNSSARQVRVKMINLPA